MAKQVAHFNRVQDLHHLHIHLKFSSPCVLLLDLEQLLKYSRHQTPMFVAAAHHGVGLTAPLRPASHDQHIVPIDGGLDQTLGLREDFGLYAIGTENCSESEGVVLALRGSIGPRRHLAHGDGVAICSDDHRQTLILPNTSLLAAVAGASTFEARARAGRHQ